MWVQKCDTENEQIALHVNSPLVPATDIESHDPIGVSVIHPFWVLVLRICRHFEGTRCYPAVGGPRRRIRAQQDQVSRLLEFRFHILPGDRMRIVGSVYRPPSTEYCLKSLRVNCLSFT